MIKSNPKKRLLFIDPIEQSSYPVSETGYALMYRAWQRAQHDGAEVYAVYPDTRLWTRGATVTAGPRVTVHAHRIDRFWASPYHHFRCQRGAYTPGADVGSRGCHHEQPAEEVAVDEAEVVIFRQESGDEITRSRILRSLASVEDDVPIYLSPRLALDPALSSKVLPAKLAAHCVPRSMSTAAVHGTEQKLDGALTFIREVLGAPDTVIAKPQRGDNGVGITALGRCPMTGSRQRADIRAELRQLMGTFGDVIVQEYVPSVRAPAGVSDLADVPLDRHDFGEIRFLLIDGTIPRDREGLPIKVARRVPASTSLIADSGISHPTTLSRAEVEFVMNLGRAYLRLGILFGGGDLIRTPDPERPYLFTDAARSVCGHAVVTGALNGDPYMIIDKILDSVDRHVARRAAEETGRVAQLA